MKNKEKRDKRRTEIQERHAEEIQKKRKRNDPPLYTGEEIDMLKQRLEVEEKLKRNPVRQETLRRQLREADEYV